MSVSSTSRQRIQLLGLFGGPALALVCFLVVGESTIEKTVGGVVTTVEFGQAGRATLALMVWMAVWWLTEAIDVSATALLPALVLPIATISAFTTAGGAMRAAAEPYANPLIALFMGGFMLALAMERWGLHRRIALLTLRVVGTHPMAMIAGFMACTAVMSMWVSNTATTIMMLPIALSVCTLLDDRGPDDPLHRRNFKLCLMLGIAYAATVGGIGTLIGTPPNLLLAGFVSDTYGVEIGFVQWLGVGLPLVAVFVPLIFILLTRVIYPISTARIEGSATMLREQLHQLGPVKPAEWATFITFMCTATCWLLRPIIAEHLVPGLTDAGIAIGGALVLFVIPADRSCSTFVMDWDTARRLPWGILVLFGGGLSLAAAVTDHGVADMLGAQVAEIQALPGVLIVVLVVAGVIFLTELTSNTATTATLLPILAGLAPALGMDPMLLLVPAAIAASCAFMMPVATPPNAIVFGSGHVTIPQMCKAGLWLNLIGVALVTALAYAVVVPLLAGR